MSFHEFTEDEILPAVARETRSRKQHARPNYLAALAWAIGGLLVAGVLLYIAAPKKFSQPQQLPLTAVSQTEAPPLIEKNVEDIRAGDLVVSYDEATGQQVFNRVVESYERTSYHLRFIEAHSLESGEVQTFETTDEHPFWQVDVGWVEAADLAVGDQLLQSNGKFAEIVSTGYEAHPEGVTVYNFQVADSHSYYVSAPHTRGPPLLVHNAEYGVKGGLNPHADGSLRLGEIPGSWASAPKRTAWPSTTDEMDDFLGVPGQRVPDGPTTPGRDKTVWRPNADTKITLERHPYHPNAPDWHRDYHWHLDTPNNPHQRFVPGDEIPGLGGGGSN